MIKPTIVVLPTPQEPGIIKVLSILTRFLRYSAFSKSSVPSSNLNEFNSDTKVARTSFQNPGLLKKAAANLLTASCSSLGILVIELSEGANDCNAFLYAKSNAAPSTLINDNKYSNDSTGFVADIEYLSYGF
jgi:hypothetical protein